MIVHFMLVVIFLLLTCSYSIFTNDGFPSSWLEAKLLKNQAAFIMPFFANQKKTHPYGQRNK